MDKEIYVSLKCAKMLKEKGFDEQCRYTYCGESEENVYVGNNKNSNYPNNVCSMPTLYEAQKWLWENHRLLVNAFLKAPFGQPYEFMYCIQDAKNTLDDYGTSISDESYGNLQEALNTGIIEVLKII